MELCYNQTNLAWLAGQEPTIWAFCPSPFLLTQPAFADLFFFENITIINVYVSEGKYDMKRSTFGVLIAVALSTLLVVCCKDSSTDTSLFTVEVIDEVRYIHNHASQLGDIPGVKLELIGRIGKIVSEDEKDILYDPADAARLSNGDILILEGRGCTVKRYNKDHEYISSFSIRFVLD